MKFEIVVKDKYSQWTEKYNENIENAEEFAKKIVANFNGSLREHESPRELVSVKVLDENNGEFHHWVKLTSGMSQMFRGQCVDMFQCSNCGITGKRYGIHSKIINDSKYRKKAFRKCDTSIEYLKKYRNEL